MTELPSSNAFGLTESIIRSGATPESFERGMKLYRHKAVSETVADGNCFSGVCEGANQPHYEVSVELDAAGVRSAECTCGSDWEGYCKHQVALLITCLHHPERFLPRLQLPELLADLDRDHLVALIGRLVQTDPDLYDWIAAEAQAVPPCAGQANKPSRTRRKVDAEVYRRQTGNILHSLDRMRRSEAYWHVGDLVAQLEQLRAQSMMALDNADPAAALEILLPLLEESSKGFEFIDDSNGTLGGFVETLGRPLAEVLLSLEMPAGDRAQLTKQLNRIAKQLSDYGLDGVLDAALHVLRHGWDELSSQIQDSASTKRKAPLVLLKGGENEIDPQDEEVEDEWPTERNKLDDLTEAKLNVLQRQGRTEEYLALCDRAGCHHRYAFKLCELNRVDEAIAYALARFQTCDDALEMAQRLRELGRVDDALAVAERGLQLGGSRFILGEWLAPMEEAQGRTAQALQAWCVVFAQAPSLKCYQALARLAGSNWPELRRELMTSLQRREPGDVLAEIYTSEGEWDEAIAIADRDRSWYTIVERVAEAILKSAAAPTRKHCDRPNPAHLEWVARACQEQAQGLVTEARSKYYPIAVRWLKRAKKAYTLLERTQQWDACLADWKEKYKRRPALMEELRKL